MWISAFATARATSSDVCTLCGKDAQFKEDLVVLYLQVSKLESFHNSCNLILAPTEVPFVCYALFNGTGQFDGWTLAFHSSASSWKHSCQETESHLNFGHYWIVWVWIQAHTILTAFALEQLSVQLLLNYQSI